MAYKSIQYIQNLLLCTTQMQTPHPFLITLTFPLSRLRSAQMVILQDVARNLHRHQKA